ncbi:MAG: alpha/beta hydrolase [Proteobacteria bacterium]|nr:alpha/beta hydrolase [Pseudomonadota bacterium]
MKYLIYAIFIFLMACSSAQKPYDHHTHKVINQAFQQGFTQKQYATHYFVLTTFEHIPQPAPDTLYVYIEGDGNSWKTRYRLSDNPTPKQPLGLKLAINDPHPGVIYIGRPCQYTPLALDKNCDPKYWSSHRYAPEVISSFDELLTQVKNKHKNTNFVLVGFSGGASVALLSAAKRKDVIGIFTVAGDLDHEILNQHHKTTPLTGSLNPSTVAKQINPIPQHHWVGDKDTIVPMWLAQSYAQKANNPSCVKVFTLKGASHHKGWEQKWREIVSAELKC